VAWWDHDGDSTLGRDLIIETLADPSEELESRVWHLDGIAWRSHPSLVSSRLCCEHLQDRRDGLVLRLVRYGTLMKSCHPRHVYQVESLLIRVLRRSQISLEGARGHLSQLEPIQWLSIESASDLAKEVARHQRMVFRVGRPYELHDMWIQGKVVRALPDIARSPSER
jgi:hypothetical protein